MPKTRKFAEGTTVSVINSRLEIEKIILKYAGPKAEFAYLQREGFHDIIFVAHQRRVRFSLPIPTGAEAREALQKYRYSSTLGTRITIWIEEESRRRWRCLVLAIKAKLVVVDSGAATFEEEFLAHIVNKAGMSVYQMVQQARNGVPMLEAVKEGEVVTAEIVNKG